MTPTTRTTAAPQANPNPVIGQALLDQGCNVNTEANGTCAGTNEGNIKQ